MCYYHLLISEGGGRVYGQPAAAATAMAPGAGGKRISAHWALEKEVAYVVVSNTDSQTDMVSLGYEFCHLAKLHCITRGAR